PLLGGCTAAYLVSLALMQNSIMTEKIARRGVRVPADYAADLLDQLFVRELAMKEVTTLSGVQTLADVRIWLNSRATGTTHQGYPVLASDGALVGVVTRRDVFDTSKPDTLTHGECLRRDPITIDPKTTLRGAADIMVREGIGRLIVIEEGRIVGLLTRGDLLAAQKRRLADAMLENPIYKMPRPRLRFKSSPPAA
ncbi:MAG TPA: CBS domain-containing protein, partial [Polyangiaceae bacterium]